MEPEVDPAKVSFFMPDHNGPCRFGQYNRFQWVLFDKLGFEKTEIIAPSNDNSYEDISSGHGSKFRLNAWKGFVAMDLVRKMKQERKPYELIPGNTEKVYQQALTNLVHCMENGGGELIDTLAKIALSFTEIPLSNGRRKPVIIVVGEIFMRDNDFCSGHLVTKLEKFAKPFHGLFDEDKGGISYVNIAYDGQEDASIELRLQAFVHQTKQYAEEKGLIQISTKLVY